MVPGPLYIETSLVHSPILSNKSGATVYLKLENTQPCGSFKNRGISHICQRSLSPTNPSQTNLIISSGGNAGLACAYSSVRLGCKSTIFVPEGAGSKVVERLRSFGGGVEVVRGGVDWKEADERAREKVAQDDFGVYIPPFDHPLVVEGHSSIISEITRQLKDAAVGPPDAIICSVGGGGLLAGILEGMNKDQTGTYEKTSILAIETFGSSSLSAAVQASYKTVTASNKVPTPTSVTLPRIDTIASSLGCRCVTNTVLESCLKWDQNGAAEKGGGEVVSVVVGDERCLDTIKVFADDHHLLLEPACSACLIPLYNPSILALALPSFTAPPPYVTNTTLSASLTSPSAERKKPVIIVILCGGSLGGIERWAEWEEVVHKREKLEQERRVEVFSGRRGVEVWKEEGVKVA